MRLTDIMSNAGLSGYAEVALILLFFAAFIGVAIATFLPSRKHEMDRAARLPLEDSAPITPTEKRGRP